MINISGLDKAAVLAALYNNAKPQGWGYLHYQPGDITREQAVPLLEHGTEFEYLQGRVMKVDLSCDEFDEWLYDRDNGQRAAQRAVETARKEQEATK